MSLFDTDATISCMSKAGFDKLDPKPTLIQTHMYKVNGAKGIVSVPLAQLHVLWNSPRNPSNSSYFVNSYFHL